MCVCSVRKLSSNVSFFIHHTFFISLDFHNLYLFVCLDPDDFIVDEEGQPISRGKKKRTVVHSDKALQEAQEVFGVDFDFTEFEDFGSDYEDEEEEEV